MIQSDNIKQRKRSAFRVQPQTRYEAPVEDSRIIRKLLCKDTDEQEGLGGCNNKVGERRVEMSLFSSTNFRSNRIITEFRGNNLLFELVHPTDSIPFVLLVADPMGKLYGSSVNSINSTLVKEDG
ncbi:hypothetical protein HZH66_006569 [Vespula vulgaris]|uniref:Uncharacterized protein n=1 Tax=Vespula vulgaris TaxID=7454 RepID=A0A834N739_VESVU|nr:hypothetical protein HZH66_006569 [Vespula vulgaris]